MEQVVKADAVGIDESKKVLEIVGDFASKLANVDFKKLSDELSDLDNVEKKELLSIAAKKILSGLLVIVSM